jgi:mRNA interferase RelE/StbE
LKYKVVLIGEAACDFKSLDGSVKILVAKQLKKLEYAPYLGEHLGKRGPFNLTGYYKMYVAKKTIRIVYRIIDKEVMVEVIAIGKRENIEVYKETFDRILKYN